MSAYACCAVLGRFVRQEQQSSWGIDNLDTCALSHALYMETLPKQMNFGMSIISLQSNKLSILILLKYYILEWATIAFGVGVLYRLTVAKCMRHFKIHHQYQYYMIFFQIKG